MPTQQQLLRLCTTLLFAILPTALCDAGSCSPPYPGVDIAISGFDLTEFDALTNIGPTFTSSRIINITCHDNKHQIVPGSTVPRAVPDQLILTQYSSGLVIEASAQQSSFLDFQASLSTSFSVGGGGLFGQASFSKAVNRAGSVMLNTSAFADIAIGRIDSFVLAPRFAWQLTPSIDAITDLDHYLPKVVFDAESVPAWATFFQKVGTHYMGRSSFGGEVFFAGFSGSALLKWMSAEQISVEAKAALLNILAAAGSGSGSTSIINQHYIQASANYSHWKGGGGNPGSDFGAWASAVPASPVPLQAAMINISTLWTNAGAHDVAAVMSSAMDNYFWRRGLEALVMWCGSVASAFNATVSSDPACLSDEPLCRRIALVNGVEKIAATATSTLNTPIVNKIAAGLLAAQFATQMADLPSAPGTVVTGLHPGSLGTQLFCAISTIQIGHNSVITNNYATVKMDPSSGVWSFGYTASPVDTKDASCMTGVGTGVVQTFTTPGNITNALFCALSGVQNGWNSNIGNAWGSVVPTSDPYTWSFANPQGRPVVQSVTCVMRSPETEALLPGWSAVSYHNTLGSIGQHFFCALATVQTGFETSIGNQVTSVTGSAFGEWTLASGRNPCATCHAAVCIG